MQIRILTSRGGHACGAIVDVPEAAAAAWIGAGDAERVVVSVEVAADGPGPEAAVGAPPENAMRLRARGRGGRG